MIDNRLKKAAEFVSGRGVACDVGTDHAHLAVYLISGGRCREVIASDIGKGPLSAAAKTVSEHGLSDKISLVLSDGLENVPLDRVSDIIIAGMGGETITDIIRRTDEHHRNNIRWILQPMTKPEILRRELYKMGLRLIKEEIVEDGRKMYTVMCAEFSADTPLLTETEAYAGMYSCENSPGREYRAAEIARLRKIAAGLSISGDHSGSTHYNALALRLEKGSQPTDITAICRFFDSLYPFSTQEKWDNSGLLAENESMSCRKILLTLDITCESISEAERKGAELMISHHPVIFQPLKNIRRSTPVFRLIRSGIAALCMHTNLDIANNGTNGVILDKLRERLSIKETLPFENCGGGRYLGYIADLQEAISPDDLGALLKDIFGCAYVRASHRRENISRIAFCSGSGGSMLELALENGCDAYITGDVKHDVWIDAANRGIALFDCGHFHTENIVLPELKRILEKEFPLLDVEIAESSSDPVRYI